MGLMDIFQAFFLLLPQHARGRTGGVGASRGRHKRAVGQLFLLVFSGRANVDKGIAACGGVHLKCHCICRRLCKFCLLLLLQLLYLLLQLLYLLLLLLLWHLYIVVVFPTQRASSTFFSSSLATGRMRNMPALLHMRVSVCACAVKMRSYFGAGASPSFALCLRRRRQRIRAKPQTDNKTAKQKKQMRTTNCGQLSKEDAKEVKGKQGIEGPTSNAKNCYTVSLLFPALYSPLCLSLYLWRTTKTCQS